MEKNLPERRLFMNDRPAIHWLAGGILLAAVLLFTVATVKPIGVSTQYVCAAGGIAELASPGAISRNTYFQKEKVGFGYAEMLVLAIPLGGFLAALATRRWKLRAVPEPWRTAFGSSRPLRFAAAFLGGFLLLFGARLAGGCTSGHILSGVSQLAISSILFFLAAFGSALVFARALYPIKEARS
jgi:uncharacterized membrane protein YedE/YeeE